MSQRNKTPALGILSHRTTMVETATVEDAERRESGRGDAGEQSASAAAAVAAAAAAAAVCPLFGLQMQIEQVKSDPFIDRSDAALAQFAASDQIRMFYFDFLVNRFPTGIKAVPTYVPLTP